MNCIHSKNKQLLLPLRSAMYDFEEGSVQQELEKLIASDAKIRMPFPFKDLIGSEAFFETATPLYFVPFQIWRDDIGLLWQVLLNKIIIG